MRIYDRPIVLILIFCTICHSQRTALDDGIELYRFIRETYFRIIGKTSAPGGQQVKAARRQGKVQPITSLDKCFPCNVTNARSPQPPESVDNVRPGDIDVIAALGDSLTAGFGAAATEPLHVLIENRGISWNGGGQGTWREFLTLPNIIKVFNPNVTGYALSDAFTTHQESRFNIAEGLAISRDLPYMAENLVKRIKRDPKVDLKSHWKLISLMIGPNDFCNEMCYQRSPWSILDKHRQDLLTTFRTIRDNLPRTIIALVLAPNLKILLEFNGRPPFCQTVNYAECSCLFRPWWRPYIKEYYAIMREWQKLEEEIALLEEFQTEDFAIVSQPFTRNLSFPVLASGLTDFTYLSVDCFHLSQKSYARAANALWNNLLEPVGKKSTDWDEPFDKFLCPTPERPYISTLRNSII